jgi:NAD dependent epimerase/dehydratase family enzyme
VALGEMAEDLLLASQRAMPQALLDAGFDFRFARLEDALRHTLGRS